MRTASSIAIARARVLNQAAPALAPIRTGPGHLRSNSLPSADCAWEAEEQPEELSPAARARLARICAPKATPATLALGFQPVPLMNFEEVKIMQPTGKFRTLKKGPRAGQTIEEQAMIKLGIWTVRGMDGTSYRFTTRSTNVTRISPQAVKSRLTPAQCTATFQRIFTPDVAPRVIAFLLGTPIPDHQPTPTTTPV